MSNGTAYEQPFMICYVLDLLNENKYQDYRVSCNSFELENLSKVPVLMTCLWKSNNIVYYKWQYNGGVYHYKNNYYPNNISSKAAIFLQYQY